MTGPARRRKVLFVEDEPGLRSAYARLFVKRYEMAFAATGAEALSELGRFAPDVVVLDLRLPDVDGVDVLTKIRQARVPVRTIVTSAYASMEPQLALMDLGHKAYLQKPFDPEDLAQLIDEVADR